MRRASRRAAPRTMKTVPAKAKSRESKPVRGSSEAAGADLVRTTGCARSTGTPIASDPLRAIESSGSASGVFGNVVDVTAAVAGRAGGMFAVTVVVVAGFVVVVDFEHGFSLILVDVLVEELVALTVVEVGFG